MQTSDLTTTVCACPNCQMAQSYRVGIDAWMQDEATKLAALHDVPTGKKVIMQALALALGDAIGSWVDREHQVADLERVFENIRANIECGPVVGVTIQ